MKTLLLFAILSLLVSSDTFYAKVIGVTDGDTIVVLTDNNKQIKIRLEGIDCPESSQNFGEMAKQATVALCFKKKVKVKETGKDKYGRTLAFVFVKDLCVNNELIKEGMAWHYKKHNHDPELAELEQQARAKKIGLWSQSAPTAPWDYRSNK